LLEESGPSEGLIPADLLSSLAMFIRHDSPHPPGRRTFRGTASICL